MSEAGVTGPARQAVVKLPARPRPRLHQVLLAFPLGPEAEYRWAFKDGTRSPWKPAPAGVLRAPPFALGCEWRAVLVARAEH